MKNDVNEASVESVVLLPCPFCGGAAGYIPDNSYGLSVLGCGDEDCIAYAMVSGPPFLDGSDDLRFAADAWNTRAGQ